VAIVRVATRFLLAALLVGVVAACGGSDSDEPSAAAPRSAAEGRLADLTEISQLRDAFNRDKGLTRLVLLLSPT
jgi:hypothetical protein